jgi:two-component system OmpR family sensor kinase
VSRILAAWRRLRVGTQLALGLGALALVVFAVVGTVLVTTMQGYLADRLDDQLTRSQLDQTTKLRNYGGPPRAPYDWFSAVYKVDNGTAEPTAVANLPNDSHGLADVAKDSTRTEVLRTVYVEGAGSYRVRGCPLVSGQVLVSAAPKSDLDNTVQRLIFVAGLAFVVALALLVFVGRMVLRKGLRPLSDMANTAHDITSRDLTKSAELPVRVSGDGGGVEVEELRTAFNRMLEHIDASLAVRTAANERLRRFVADASHELRTPLTSIRGYADLFHYAAANEPAERDAHLAKIREETARMSVLVDDLLLLARLDSPDQETPLRLERIELGVLANAAAEAFRAAHPHHPLQVTMSGSGPLWLRADPIRLRQVLDNLLANVAAHTPPGTSATLGVGAAGGWAQLSVVDTGPGIPAEHQPQIFDRFYRADDSRSRRNGGSGLGLSVVQMLVVAHGGTVEVASAPGRTAFTVRLPGAEVY